MNKNFKKLLILQFPLFSVRSKTGFDSREAAGSGFDQLLDKPAGNLLLAEPEQWVLGGVWDMGFQPGGK